ncbi:MAG TPA: glycogen debranching protein GlgX [Thermomicrobiaceae bacterium]|nr:glycogen debranching protein GlgX [Thermomicrobiaceae bacterium]
MARAVRRVLPGKPFPLGATWDGEGVNFSIYSEHATTVELCLFDDPTGVETGCIRLTEVTAHVWHAYVAGLSPGQLYGYRVHGPYEPDRGLRFNPHKVLLDPYARAVTGSVDWQAPVFGYHVGEPDADRTFDDQDDARSVPKGIVAHPFFDWDADRKPNIPWHRSVIYEVHVKGFSQRNSELPEEERGTYAGLAAPESIAYLQQLGITAVELLPVQYFIDDGHLIERGLTNYWGYNSINYFSPVGRYSRSGESWEQIAEFKRMVHRLHRAGIEVILDVVYNHTAEGNELGPTLSFRGIDNPTYYKLMPDNPRYYRDYTGTGNSLNVGHPQVLKLIMDSLRYWVTEMRVDGFRFDLAAALARELHDVDRLSAFFDIIHQDPIISQAKLIAEPWDVGEGGYQVGNFPVLWAEWNGKYRDTTRRYWRGDESQVAELGYRLTGSSDLYVADGRRPYASINFVTAHDGFTLHDLVSFNDKHNGANGEDNRDGTDNNLSWNCGVEGPTDDPGVLALREQQMRNFLATLLFSQGVPMIQGGDELGRTQAGNNNGYCQDNEISWYDWQIDGPCRRLFDFTRRLIDIRLSHPSLHRRKFFQGRRIRGLDIRDITWLRPDGGEMTDTEWHAGWVRTLGMRLAGADLGDVDERGKSITDDILLILLNAHAEAVPFVLPASQPGLHWDVLVDTARPDVLPGSRICDAGAPFDLQARSLVLFRRVEPENGAVPPPMR